MHVSANPGVCGVVVHRQLPMLPLRHGDQGVVRRVEFAGGLNWSAPQLYTAGRNPEIARVTGLILSGVAQQETRQVGSQLHGVHSHVVTEGCGAFPRVRALLLKADDHLQLHHDLPAFVLDGQQRQMTQCKRNRQLYLTRSIRLRCVVGDEVGREM